MTKKDYELIASVIWRSGVIRDKNQLRQQAKEAMRSLIVSGLIGELKHDNPNFNENLFIKACGLNQ